MRRHEVRLDRQALVDLEDIADDIACRGSLAQAEQVAQRIEQTSLLLADSPSRGSHPYELLEFGNRLFREVPCKPYRIVYRIYEREVVIMLIADGRRDMRALLARRLLAA
ncbi:MAG: type II toxin-antitoxin system RelE/ParE family toxin [Reyranella sp.]|uniref:type II toxin-antitoxin system RelE/ParE family toxin n=1 Tax=Reyranella sp. TaxID=1929291 RepID=UPI003D0DE627